MSPHLTHHNTSSLLSLSCITIAESATEGVVLLECPIALLLVKGNFDFGLRTAVEAVPILATAISPVLFSGWHEPVVSRPAAPGKNRRSKIACCHFAVTQLPGTPAFPTTPQLRVYPPVGCSVYFLISGFLP